MKKIKLCVFFAALFSLSILFTGCLDGFLEILTDDSSAEISYIEPNISYNETFLSVGDTRTLDWYYIFEGKNYAHLVSETRRYDLFTITSSDSSILSVGSNGEIKAKSAGSAYIIVSAKKGSSYYTSFSVDFNVSGDKFFSDVLSYMTLEKQRVSLYTDSSYNLYYYIYSFDGHNYGGPVTVTSSNTKVFTAKTISDYAGYVVITPIEEGSAILTVTSSDNPKISATCTVTVLDTYVPTYKVTNITISESTVTLDKKESYQLYTSSTDSRGSPILDSIKWSSNDESIATVTNGIVTGVSAGTAIITATSKDNPRLSDICYVTVTNTMFIPVTNITFPDRNLTLTRGESKTISVYVTPSNLAKPLDWSVTSNILSVTPDEQDFSTCIINALAEGNCTLIAMSPDGYVYDTCNITIKKPATGFAKQYFWGTWVRMDNGKEIVIDESYITADKTQYLILSTSDDTVLNIDGSINGIKSLTKKTNNVIEAKLGDAVIPFYRKGGTNLEYTLKVVGFTNNLEPDRAASSTIGKSGLKVKGESNRFVSYETSGETDADGNVTLTAPVQGDVQTVTVQVNQTQTVTLENLKIENDGSYMGIVPIVDANDPVLKVSGFIEEDQKSNEYIYSGKDYIMTIYIKNISEVIAQASILEIKPEDESVISIEGIDSSDGIKNPKAYTIPTLKQGITLERKIKIHVNSISDPYVQSKINVNITTKNKKWNDYIPIRVYRENVTFSIGASGDYNSDAALNGFIIYPDGNNKFFSVRTGKYINIEVPRFKSTDSYMLVFSGATTTGSLENTTELYYTVSFDGTRKAFSYENVSDSEELGKIMYFGEGDEGSTGNETEYTAFPVTDAFEAYIEEGEIDFYKVNLKNDTSGNMSDLPEKSF